MTNSIPKQKDAALKPYPSKLFVETTTRCNLQCSMCIKQKKNGEFREGDMSLATFNALLPALSTAEAVVLNGLGEPLLHPSLAYFVRLAKVTMDEQGWVGFQSNGQLLNLNRAHSLVKAGIDRVCLSVDAVSPDTFRSIRQGGEFKDVEQALDIFDEVRTLNDRKLDIGVEFVLRRDNIEQLPGTIRWAASHGADFIIVTHLLPYHPSLLSQTVYGTQLDASVSMWYKYMETAGKDRVEIKRFNKIFLKYQENSGERKIVRLMEALKAETLDNGTFLNLQQLFSKDPAWWRKMEKIFSEARSMAFQRGIRLSLPELAPKRNQRCEFVDEGSVFVSWDGNIHPCYFLWHHYHCFINGIEREERPMVLGNLSERGILEIWNDPAFVSFRQNVLCYEYPFCFNCSFALCDYAQGGFFEQDCYINTEPCGACLWGMDAFRCHK